jgi:hypothetical protein
VGALRWGFRGLACAGRSKKAIPAFRWQMEAWWWCGDAFRCSSGSVVRIERKSFKKSIINLILHVNSAKNAGVGYAEVRQSPFSDLIQSNQRN